MEYITGEHNCFGVLVADHITAMLGYWDKDLICRFANAAYSDWFGRTRDEMVGKLHIKELLGPLFEKNRPYIEKVLEGWAQTFEREIIVPDGTKRFSLANYNPHIVAGEVVGFFVHVADITPIKILEKELEQLNENYRNQNNRLLNFANTVTHNLLNYSYAFQSIVEMLEEARDEQKRIERLAQLKSFSVNFSQTILNLKEVAQAQNAEHVIFKTVNLFEFAERAIDSLVIKIIQNQVIVKNWIDREISAPVVPAYLDSIFVNLISNAIKYKHPDRSPIVELKSEYINNELCISVKDNGLGINLALYGKDLFGLYKAFNGQADSHGVGLYITKYQVESIGGRIDVESQEGIGSSFKIYFKQAERS